MYKISYRILSNYWWCKIAYSVIKSSFIRNKTTINWQSLSLSIFQIWREQSLADANSPTAYFKRKQTKTGETYEHGIKNLSIGTIPGWQVEKKHDQARKSCLVTELDTITDTDVRDMSVHVSIEWPKQSSVVIILIRHAEIQRISMKQPLFTILMIHT